MTYRVYFIGERGQGYTDIESDSKEAAIKQAEADLNKSETILTAEERSSDNVLSF